MLRRMFQTIQAPLYESAMPSMAGSADEGTGSSAAAAPVAGLNTSALPNPWAPPPPRQPAAMPNPWAPSLQPPQPMMTARAQQRPFNPAAMASMLGGLQPPAAQPAPQASGGPAMTPPNPMAQLMAMQAQAMQMRNAAQQAAQAQQPAQTQQQSASVQPPAVPAAPSVPPAQLYASQLQLMTEMGFPDQDANLQALVATGGNLDAAISRLVGS